MSAGRSWRRELLFISHETYTPARGGSAAAEIHALRQVFGEDADRVVIANTKGFTGHPMGVGIEDVLAVKALETGVVPHVPNFHEPDPELGSLNLSHGGAYPISYALRLAAGFGSQISMLLLRWTPVADGRRRNVDELGYAYRIADRDAWTAWLRRVSGHDEPKLEVVTHRLRVADQGPAAAAAAAREPEPSRCRSERRSIMRPSRHRRPRRPSPPPRLRPLRRRHRPRTTWRRRCWRSSPPRPATRPTSWTSTSTSRPTWASTPSSRPRCSRRSARPTASSATTTSSSATTPRSPTSSSSSTTAHPRPHPHPPAAAPAAAAPPATAPAAADVEAQVLAIVAEQTGYPTDLLDLDLDLEADLGIDTVKQAEVFATIRETYGIERDDSLKLRDYPTLTHVVGFVHDRAPQTNTAPVETPAAAPEPAPAPVAAPAAVDGVEARVMEIVAAQTGYPTDLLDLDLDLEADLGIDTVKQAEVFATIRETYGIERDDNLKLRDYPTLNHVVGFVHDRIPHTEPVAEPAPRLRPLPLRPRLPRTASRRRCWRSSPRRPATRPTSWTWTSTSRPTSASTPSSRPRCSPPSARPTASSATTTSSSATTRPSPTSSASSATAPRARRKRLRRPRKRPPPLPARPPRSRGVCPSPSCARRSTSASRPVCASRPAAGSCSCPTAAASARRSPSGSPSSASRC